MDRKLVTIVAADVAGFSRLVGADEEATLAALRERRGTLIDRHSGHRRRLVPALIACLVAIAAGIPET